MATCTDNTKVKFFSAIDKFLEDRPLSKITVTDIVKECDLGRKTFYRHFEDIYDLLLWFYDVENDSRELFYSTKDFRRCIYNSLRIFKLRSNLYKKLFLSGDQIFLEKYIRSRIELPKKAFGEAYLTPEVCYALELFWSGYTYIIIQWMRNGMKESPEVMTEYALQALPDILKKLYRV